MELLSWNVQAAMGVDGRTDLERVARVVRGARAPDVICLQEVAQGFPQADGGPTVDQVAELSARFPDHAAFFGPAIDRLGPAGARVRFGNLVLSQLAVEQCFTHPLPQPAQAAVRHMPRQATEVVVRDGERTLRIVTAHLEYHSQAHRLAQVERLLALHREVVDNAREPPRADADGPYAAVPRPVTTVMCGDFNFCPGEPEYAAMLASGDEPAADLVDAWTHLRGTEPHRPTCGVFDRRQWPQGPHCRDFFFVTRDLLPRLAAVEVDEATDASDHQPVTLRLAGVGPPRRGRTNLTH